MAKYRDFEIEMTVVPDAAGQYEAAFELRRAGDGERAGKAGDADRGRYQFPPVGSYMTPDDAREQTAAWAHKWIDANFGK
ncbi:hypothetical protein CAL12_07000 [Bordetella genomosp. 8]|uniref:Uncharacterized protein n=1 Tax=Bordetella genomosp. 8 TaxID=1416806 RepID=A0A1W6YHN1_9BORD|nr:hypothetical protein [Bordetella genomosp. 8]ARP80606.1 hypothetical protein CAL12_07000 [Bordetella genomosp. 8]